MATQRTLQLVLTFTHSYNTFIHQAVLAMQLTAPQHGGSGKGNVVMGEQ